MDPKMMQMFDVPNGFGGKAMVLTVRKKPAPQSSFHNVAEFLLTPDSKRFK